jgi:adenine-specific DNA-methyltransferase
MYEISFLQNPEGWRRALGLLPIPLLKSPEPTNRFVLLNGQGGNFCLDLSQNEDTPIVRCSSAWSSNVGHYISFNRQFVDVLKWNEPEKIERFSTPSVISNLQKFHSYLEKSEPDQEKSIVRHCLRVFRSLRQILSDEREGFRSLQVFLAMIASVASNDSIENINAADWGIDNIAITNARQINSLDLETLVLQLSGMGAPGGLKPDYRLLLRHASGVLFQEAHLQAQISLQNWLPGFGPTILPLASKESTFTGIYFTPQSIARTLAEEALRHRDITKQTLTIFDPTCGSGELLKEALRMLELQNFEGNVELIGWDISPGAIDMAKFSLTWESKSWADGRLTLNLHVRNSLNENWPIGVDVLLMNPPFKSWQAMEVDEQERVSEILIDLMHNKPNLAAAFSRLAANAVALGGVLGMVAPSSFFEGDSSKKLRHEIASTLKPKLIAKLGNQALFFNALVDAGLFVGKKEEGGDLRGPIMIWADHTKEAVSSALRSLRQNQINDMLPVDEEKFSLYRDDASTSLTGSWSPRKFSSWALFHQATTAANTVSASRLFDIHQGARLGNDIFILDKDVVLNFPKPEQKFFRPAVVNSSIINGKLSDGKYAFFPYSHGLPAITTEDLLIEHVPTYFRNYLSNARPALQSRKTLERGGNWWDLLWPRSWQFENQPKIVTKYFGKQGCFAYDNEGKYVVVVGNGWIYKENSPKKKKVLPWDEDTAYAYLAYLNSPLVEALISCMSSHVGGGQWDLSRKYLSQLPILDMSLVKATTFRSLVDFGKAFASGSLEDLSLLNETCLNALNEN